MGFTNLFKRKRIPKTYKFVVFSKFEYTDDLFIITKYKNHIVKKVRKCRKNCKKRKKS